jgi:hypothetical protein
MATTDNSKNKDMNFLYTFWSNKQYHSSNEKNVIQTSRLPPLLTKPRYKIWTLNKHRNISFFITCTDLSINSFFNTVSVSRYSRPITLTRDPD